MFDRENFKGWFTQVPSDKSQLVSLKQSQKCGSISLKPDLHYFMQKYSWDLG